MLSKEQIADAIEQMKVQCELKMPGYEACSARGVLIELGYEGENVEQVLETIAASGFTYCLDPRFAATHFDPNNRDAVNDMVTDRPSADACYWGPDQLKSRLGGVRV